MSDSTNDATFIKRCCSWICSRSFWKQFRNALFVGQKNTFTAMKISADVAICLFAIAGSFLPCLTRWTGRVSIVIGDIQEPMATINTTFGVIVCVVLVIVAIAVCLFLALERYHNIRFSKLVLPAADDDKKYWLTVFNDGNGNALVRTFVVDTIVAGRRNLQGGEASPVNHQLPHSIELRWGGGKGEPASISRQRPGRFLLFLVEMQNDHKALCLGAGEESATQSLELLNLDMFGANESLWVQVLAEDQDGKSTDTWYKLTHDESKPFSSGLCKVIAATPPDEVLAKRRQWDDVLSN